jgi:hypothetical protein
MTEEGLFQFGYSKDHRPDLLLTARIVARDLFALGSAFFKTTAQNDMVLDLV